MKIHITLHPIKKYLKTTKFALLDPNYKKSLITWWDELFGMKHYDFLRDVPVQYGVVPMHNFLEYLATFPFYKNEGLRSIEEWHKWYVENDDTPTHKETWAVILWEGEEEPLADGWHRLNSYIRSKRTFLPVVYCPEALHILDNMYRNEEINEDADYESESSSKLPFYRDCTQFNQKDTLKKGGLSDMVQNRIDISYKTFRSKVDDTDWKELVSNLGYNKDLKIQDDWAVSFYRSKLFGHTVYFIRHSSIEYIFANL